MKIPFSLETYIDWCLFPSSYIPNEPSISFRLLTFPSLDVHPESKNVLLMPPSVIEEMDILSFIPLHIQNNFIPAAITEFRQGTSCQFRLDQLSLASLLSGQKDSIPLYAVLFDEFPKTTLTGDEFYRNHTLGSDHSTVPRVIATAAIDLNSFADNILDPNSTDTPYKTGSFVFYNPKGEPIGIARITISFQKINSRELQPDHPTNDQYMHNQQFSDEPKYEYDHGDIYTEYNNNSNNINSNNQSNQHNHNNQRGLYGQYDQYGQNTDNFGTAQTDGSLFRKKTVNFTTSQINSNHEYKHTHKQNQKHIDISKHLNDSILSIVPDVKDQKPVQLYPKLEGEIRELHNLSHVYSGIDIDYGTGTDTDIDLNSSYYPDHRLKKLDMLQKRQSQGNNNRNKNKNPSMRNAGKDSSIRTKNQPKSSKDDISTSLNNVSRSTDKDVGIQYEKLNTLKSKNQKNIKEKREKEKDIRIALDYDSYEDSDDLRQNDSYNDIDLRPGTDNQTQRRDMTQQYSSQGTLPRKYPQYTPQVQNLRFKRTIPMKMHGKIIQISVPGTGIEHREQYRVPVPIRSSIDYIRSDTEQRISAKHYSTKVINPNVPGFYVKQPNVQDQEYLLKKLQHEQYEDIKNKKKYDILQKKIDTISSTRDERIAASSSAIKSGMNLDKYSRKPSISKHETVQYLQKKKLRELQEQEYLKKRQHAWRNDTHIITTKNGQEHSRPKKYSILSGSQNWAPWD